MLKEKVLNGKNVLGKKALSLITAIALVLPFAAVAAPVTAYAAEYDNLLATVEYIAEYDDFKEIFGERVMYECPVVKYANVDTDVYSDIGLNTKIGEIARNNTVTVTGQYSMLQHWEYTRKTTLEYVIKDFYDGCYAYVIDYNGTTAYAYANQIVDTWEDTTTAYGQWLASRTDYAAIADEWEAAGIEDYAEIIREVHVYGTLAIEDMTYEQSALYLAAKINNPATYNVDNTALTNYGTASDEALAKADEILAQITNDSMSDYEKVKAVHDWMCENISYDWEAYRNNATQGTSIPDSDASVDGALLEGKVVCEGYAKTFQMFMDKLDIECLIMYALADGAYGTGGHAWNMVKVDDQWYHIDVTFDDSGSDARYSYKYFLVSDDTIGANHSDWRAIHSCPSNYGE